MPETRPDFYHCPDCGQALNYEPNTERFRIGAQVLHDADAKTADMLLEIVAYTGPDTCLTRYVRKRMENGSPLLKGELPQRLCNLHNPARFGIKAPPLVAWVVSDRDDNESEVTFATSRGKAIGRSLTEYAFTDRMAKRAPELDQYIAIGGPTKAELIEHGWWFECHWEDRANHRACQQHVTRDEGGVVDGKPYCTEHLPGMQAKAQREPAHATK